jgi:BrnA antitoxin of type II toxin-antitoxin system
MEAEYDFIEAKRGAVIPQTGKTLITIYIDDDVLETFRERSDATGKGYQTIMNEALREYLNKVKQPLDEETLRRVIQEELRAAKYQIPGER